jgi:threonine dehydrogenase-like Zn-dependent dehydrogenase
MNMQALVWTGPRQMEVRDVERPQAPEGEVVLKVATVGVCGSDLSGYLGENSLRIPPLVMGHEFTGVIVTAGSDESRLANGERAQIGQRVVVNPLIWCGTCDLCRAGRENLCRKRQIIGIHRPGAFAEFVAVPAAQCHRLPDTVSDLTSALTEPLACGIRAVTQSQIKAGESLLILGAGSIGLLCLIAARDTGVEQIFISDTSPERLAVATELGATATIQIGEQDVLAQVQRLTDGLGVVAVIDAVGLDSTREQAIKAVRPGGRAVFIGLHHETSEIAANYVVRQEIEVVGAFSYLPGEFERALRLLGTGVIPPESAWLVEKTLDEGGEVFADLVAGRGGYVKVAIKPS